MVWCVASGGVYGVVCGWWCVWCGVVWCVASGGVYGVVCGVYGVMCGSWWY